MSARYRARDNNVSTTRAPNDAIDVAARRLGEFIVEQANRARDRLGFGWRPTDIAPSTYSELRREHRASELTCLPLRVSALFCDQTIYGSPTINHAMRFWHDTEHVRLSLNFEADDEMTLGVHHLEALRREGFGAHSIEHQLLHADTIGQTLCLAVLRRFPTDQKQFCATAVRWGVQAAVERERGRMTESPLAAQQTREKRPTGGTAA